MPNTYLLQVSVKKWKNLCLLEFVLAHNEVLTNLGELGVCNFRAAGYLSSVLPSYSVLYLASRLNLY